jgi:16S rRNA (uracil1498-N3)-methyltransferase
LNLVLLEPPDFVTSDRVRLEGRRFEHIRSVHRAVAGRQIRVGLVDGKIGIGIVGNLGRDSVELRVSLDTDPPPALAVTLVLALPRPKVLNRTIAAAVSMGIREIHLINSWRVEKAYWKSPRLSPDNLRLQSILGLEQAGDTVMPRIVSHPLFTPFVREELPALLRGRSGVVAHPEARQSIPRLPEGPLVLAIGPEGGFIEPEIDALCRLGFIPVSIGPRILRVETALACLVGRIL